jgi:hypothetical protein
MRLKLTPTIVRLAVPAAVALLSTAAIAVAASGGNGSPVPAAAPAPAAKVLVRVPDVQGKVFVFAKGMLEDAGFAWKVTGSVQGYSADTVATQYPAAGTRVVDTGMPTVRVTLSRNSHYLEKGQPENTSPYAGSKIVLPRATPVANKPVVKTPAVKKPAVKKPAVKTPVVKSPVVKKPVVKKPAVHKPLVTPQSRRPAFVVPGAPKEPLDEITLTARAQKLDAWLAKHPQKTDANVQHWLYQHAWVVTGAKFGWSNGAAALRLLIHADDRVIDLWGIGSRSRADATSALREVEAKTR